MEDKHRMARSTQKDKVSKVSYQTSHSASLSSKRGRKSSGMGGPKLRAILANRGTNKVIVNGIDVTPKPLHPEAPLFYDDRQVVIMDRTGSVAPSELQRSSIIMSATNFQTQLHFQTIQESDVLRSGIISQLSSDFIDQTDSCVAYADKPSPADRGVSEEAPKQEEMPTTINLVLSETQVFYTLELPSKTVEKESEEAQAVEESNERYEYITVGKGRNRKLTTIDIQTTDIVLKTRSTLAPKCKRKINNMYVSDWVMFDTFEDLRLQRGEYTPKKVAGPKLDTLPIVSEMTMDEIEEKYVGELGRKECFRDAAMVMERILANNRYNEEQKRFRNMIERDPFRPDVDYKYRLDLLWTFSNESTKDRPVVSIRFNKFNQDILAVGYGRYFYTDTQNGLVMVWNLKNPAQPERSYEFDSPVTSISFSSIQPNLLCVGLYNGLIEVLDVSSYAKRVVGNSSRSCPSYQPIWKVAWFTGDDYFIGQEQILSICQDGRITKHRRTSTGKLSEVRMMRVPRIEGKVKGIFQHKKCAPHDIPVTRFAAALTITKHPVDKNIYYVGTDEGCIYVCSRNYLHQYIDLFLAHDGPVYQFQFSPFANKFFLTCGVDWAIRIWAEGITEPLLQLSSAMDSVEGATWSPVNCSIIASICGNNICIWDMQRKVYSPAAVIKSPTDCKNTRIRFTSDGNNLVVGDIEGNVHVYVLEDMPFPPFYPANVLKGSLCRALVTKPELVQKIRNLGNLNWTEEERNKVLFR